MHALGEIVTRLRPGLVLELGTAAGGTALFLADLLTTLDVAGTVVTVDRAPCPVDHPRLYALQGDTVSEAVYKAVKPSVRRCRAMGQPVLVILDSDHHAAHVAAELEAYAPLVTVGSYCIVEDTNLGATVLPEHGAGPAEAVAAWLAAHPAEWVVDTAVEPRITTNPGGYLRRVAV